MPTEEKINPSDLIIPTGYGYDVKRMRADEYLAAAVGWVYAAIRPIADGLGNIEFTLHKVNAKGEVETIPSHAILDLLYRCNPVQTKFDFWSLATWYLELTGEAPIVIDRAENNGRPRNLILLVPTKFSVVSKGESKNPWLPYTGFEYETSPGKKQTLSPEEVLFLKYPDPTRPFRGCPPLRAAATTVDIDRSAEKYNQKFFDNAARPAGVMSTEMPLKKEQRAALKKQVKSEFQGPENAHKTLFLEGGWKFTPTAFPPKDMEFMEQQRFDQAKILSIFGTPKPIAGISDDVNLANATTAMKVFAQLTLRPKMKRLVENLNEFLIPLFPGAKEQGLYLDFIDPTPDDQDMRLKYYQSGLTLGWMTPNEVRFAEDLEDLGPEGDVPMRSGVTPAGDSTGDGVKIARATSADIAGNKTVRVTDGQRRAQNFVSMIEEQKKEETETEKKIVEEVKPAVKAMLLAEQRKAREETWQRTVEDFWHNMVKEAEVYEEKFIRVTERVFEDQMQRIAARMPQKGVNDWLLDELEETEISVRAYLPLMNEIVLNQGKDAGKLVGLAEFNYRLDRVQKFISERTYDFSGAMIRHTNELVKETLQEGVQAGEGSAELGRRLRRSFDEFTKPRAERIARTEVLNASNYATQEAYRQSEVVQKKEWLAALDERTSVECADLDGTVVPLSKSFPGGVDFPPLHPNCRCTIIPVIDLD